MTTPPADRDAGTSLVSFYEAMTRPERATFWACFWGWSLDGFDFIIYTLVIGAIISVWNVSPGEAGLAVTVTLLASAVGGWAAGYCSDRFGRVITFQATILWFALFTCLCGLARNFDELLIARALLGLGFGGEWAAGAVLIGESIRPEARGRAVGCVQSAWAIGWGAAVAIQAIVFTWLPLALAWRVMFFTGLIPCLILIVFVRLRVPEPEIAVATRDQSAPLWAIFAPGVLTRTVLAAIAMTGAQGGYYALNSWLPTYLQKERHFSIVGSTQYLGTLILGSFIGYVVGAWLSDVIGRRKLFLTFSLGAIVIVIIYTQLPLNGTLLLILGLPLGFFSSGYMAGIGAFLTELFPTRIRGSAQGFCYNFGRGIGALFPAAVGFLSTKLPIGTAIALFAVAAYVLFFAAAFALPETRGRPLTAE